VFRIHRSRFILASLFALSALATAQQGVPHLSSALHQAAHIADGNPPWPLSPQLPTLH